MKQDHQLESRYRGVRSNEVPDLVAAAGDVVADCHKATHRGAGNGLQKLGGVMNCLNAVMCSAK